MGSLSRLPRAQRRAQLLDAAIPQFARDGYHRTSMESIAKAAGVTKPVLYQHFSSKEALYLEVIRTVGSTMAGEIDSLVRLEGDTSVRIAHALRRFTEILVSSGMSMRVLQTSERISDEVAAAVEEVLERSARSIAIVLQRSRDLTERDAQVLGLVLAGMARSFADQLSRAETVEDRSRITGLLTTFISSGLRSFPALESPQIRGTVTQSFA